MSGLQYCSTCVIYVENSSASLHIPSPLCWLGKNSHELCCVSQCVVTFPKLLLQIMASKDFVLVRWLKDESIGVMPISAVHKDARVQAHVGAVVDIKYGRRYYRAEIFQISGEFASSINSVGLVYVCVIVNATVSAYIALFPSSLLNGKWCGWKCTDTVGRVRCVVCTVCSVCMCIMVLPPLPLCLFVDNRQQLNRTCESLINFEVTREEVLAQSEVQVDSTTDDKPNPVKKPKLSAEGVLCSTKKSKMIEKKQLTLTRAETAKMRAREIFRASPSESGNDDKSDSELLKQLCGKEELINNLQKQLQV